MTALGVHSETGRLREVIVHRPDLSLRRLTPDNCKALLFDDVLWVKRARQEHDIFSDTLRERGVQVLEFGVMLAETMAIVTDADLIADFRRRILEPDVAASVPAEALEATFGGWYAGFQHRWWALGARTIGRAREGKRMRIV